MRDYRIDFVDSCRDIEPDIWAQCFPEPLEGLFWYETLETCGITDQFKFSYALIREGTKTVGVAPCFLHDVPMSLVAPPVLAKILETAAIVWPQAGYQRTFFVGSPCADEGTIGLLPGISLSDVIVPLSREIYKKAKLLRAAMVVFKDCPATNRGAMAALCDRERYFRIPSYPGADLPLAGTSLEDYFKALSRTRRHNIRKKIRRSHEQLEVETIFVKRPDDSELDEIFGLFMQTYNKGKTKFERLSIEFFRRVRETEPAWFIIQREKSNGKMLTFMLIFKFERKAINKFIGLDYAQGPDTYLYFRQFEAALEFCYSHGMVELQSGQTGYRAKLDLGHNLVMLDNYCHHTNALMHKIYGKLAEDITVESLDSDLIPHFEALRKSSQVANASRGDL